MTVWVVTGGSGFLGRCVLEALDRSAPAGTRVVALGRRLPEGWNPDRFEKGDLNDPKGLAATLAAMEPEVVIHAAGRTPPADPAALFRANTRATLDLLHALRAVGRPSRIVLAGSAAELGPVPRDDLPVSEDYPCRPTEAYGLSKWFATRAALAQSPPLEVVVARVFNPIGPGMPTSLAFGRFAELLAAPGPDPVILDVGKVNVRRDFLDVRDAAQALALLATRGEPGHVYHVGTGRSRRVGEGLADLILLSERRVEVRLGFPSPSRGPVDSRADIRKLVEHTGWSPRISFERSLHDLWVEARRRAGAGVPSPRVA